MTDHTTLIAELRQHAEWARAELNQARAELFDRSADALQDQRDTIQTLVNQLNCVPGYWP